jgi:hypothetical protein
MAELPPRCLLVVRNVEDAESATLEPRYDIGPLRLNGAGCLGETSVMWKMIWRNDNVGRS